MNIPGIKNSRVVVRPCSSVNEALPPVGAGPGVGRGADRTRLALLRAAVAALLIAGAWEYGYGSIDAVWLGELGAESVGAGDEVLSIPGYESPIGKDAGREPESEGADRSAFGVFADIPGAGNSAIICALCCCSRRAPDPPVTRGANIGGAMPGDGRRAGA